MKRITVTATCQADLTERWTWDVPDDVAAHVQACTSPEPAPTRVLTAALTSTP